MTYHITMADHDCYPDGACSRCCAMAERERICTLLESLGSEPAIDIDSNPIDAVSRYDLDLLISRLRDGSL